MSTGTDGWGMTVYVSKNPRECAPFHVYYDINRDGDPPDQVALPDAAALSFLMPDSSAAEWMVLRPPMGTGMLAWTCALPAGAQFVILNTSGYKQMFTVGPSDSASVSSSCWRNATSGITTSSRYGSLDASVYRALLSPSDSPISIADQFNQVEMPGTIGLDIIHVSLGAATGREGKNSPSFSSAATPTTTTMGVTSSATRLPQAPDGPPGTTASPSSASPSISHTHSSKKPAGNSPSTPAPLPSATQSPKGGPSKRGFIIGAVLAALALGALLGAFVVIILKRRTHLKSRALASARGSEAAQVSAFVVLSEGAEDRVRNGNSKRAADWHDELEMGTVDPRTRMWTAVSEDLPSYRSSV